MVNFFVQVADILYKVVYIPDISRTAIIILQLQF